MNFHFDIQHALFNIHHSMFNNYIFVSNLG